MTPEELERQQQEAAMAQKMNAAAAPAQPAQQMNAAPAQPAPAADPNKPRIKSSTTGELIAAPFKETGLKIAQFGKWIDPTTGKMGEKLRAIDPTNIDRADTSGVDAATANIQGVATKAGAFGAHLAANPITAQQVAAQDPGAASQTQSQAPIVANTIRGTTQQVTSGGNAVAAQMSPAQIAELQRMQAAGISREDQQFRQGQAGLVNALQAQADGTAPSLAQGQLQKANEDAIKTQAALAASARGGNPILAQRQAAMNTADLQQVNAAKSAELALQEQGQARQQLAGVLDSARGQDINVNTSQAGLDQEAAKVNKVQDDAAKLATAQLQQDASKTNALTSTEVSQFNAGQVLTRDMFNSEQDFKAAQADQAAVLDADKATALNNINTDQFNAKAKDEMARFKTDAKLRADTANQAANLQAQGMTVDAIAKMMGLENDALKAVLESETAALKIEQDRLTARKQGVTGMIGAGTAAVGAIVAAVCFPAGEQVELESGQTQSIENIQLGELLSTGRVIGLRQYHTNDALYRVGGAVMTGSHAVNVNGVWRSAGDVGALVSEVAPRTVYSLVTESGTMVVGNVLCGDDNHSAADLNAKESA